MNDLLRMAIVDPNDAARSNLKHLLLGIDLVCLEADCSRYETFSDVVGQTNPDVALISLDSDPAVGLALVSRITQERPMCPVLCLSSNQEGSLILQAMRNGAKEFLAAPPRLEDFTAALDRIQLRTSGKDSQGRVRSNRVITVCGAAGGVGCTGLATNLGCELAQSDRSSVAILDLDLLLGDADVWLDIVPDYTIRDVVENTGRLDAALLKRSLTRHPCGAFLLPRPVEIGADAAVTAQQLQRVVALLKTTFTHQVIDIGKSYGPLELAALELSDTILMMMQLDVSSVRNVVRLLQVFDQHRGLGEKIRLVANRVGGDETSLDLEQACQSIGREIDWELPEDVSSLVESRKEGLPLLAHAPNARLTRAIAAFARHIDGPADDGERLPASRNGKGSHRFAAAGAAT